MATPDKDNSAAPESSAKGGRLASVERATALVESRRGGGTTLAAPPGLSVGPDAASLWHAFLRRWFLASSLGILLGGLTLTGLWVFMPPKVAAFALLQVASSRLSLGWGGPESRGDFPTYMKTQAARIKSRDVLMKTLNQNDVRNLQLMRRQPDTLTTLTWLEENLKVDFQDGSELLTVSLVGEDPTELVVIVNGLTKSYLNIIDSQEKNQRKERVSKMKMLYEQAKEKLGEKVAARDALAKGQGAKDAVAMVQKQGIIQGQLSRTQDQFQQLQFELEKKQSQLANLQHTRQKVDTVPPPEYSAREIQETDLSFKTELLQAQQIQRLVDRMVAEGHPANDSTLLQTRKKLADLNKKITDHTEERRAELMARFRRKAAGDLNLAIAQLQQEIQPLENQARKVKEKVDVLTKETEVINISTAKNQVLEGEIAQFDQTVAALHQKMAGFMADEESESRVSMVGDAEWQPRDSKKRILLLILAPLFVLGGVVLGVSWWEFSARRIHGPEEVSSGLAMRVVGAVPALPDPRRAQKAEDADQYRHSLVESIDAIRTMLLRGASTEDLRVVMVTSAVSGEGKTTLASNLAMSLARAGRKTLLLDCDLRRPTLHQLFEQPLAPGFSEVVLGEVDVPDAVRATASDLNLSLLPAGHWDREVIQGLAKNGIENIFEKLKNEFEFIIVDSHPVLPATDSLLIGQHVDAVLVSVMRDMSQVAHVYSACQQLQTLGIRVFGAVVNGVPVPTYGQSYAYSSTSAAPVSRTR